MASYIGEEKELLCAICVGRYSVPRKLPGCVHAFCEKCILDFLLNLKKEDKLGAEFDCPACRLPSKSPEEDDFTIEWVQKMEKDTELEMKLGMQSDNTCNSEWCSQCKYLDKFIKSKFYCATCQDCFCDSCSEILHSFKMNRGHVLLDNTPVDSCTNDSVHEQAIHLLQKFLRCQDHPDKRVNFYCENEDKFCCMLCTVAKHQHCLNVKAVDEICETDSGKKRDDLSSEKLLDSLTKLFKHIQTIIGLMKDKENETKKTPDKLAVEFQDMKQKVIRLLDSIEENIMQESRSASKAISIKTMDEIQELNDIASEVNIVMYLMRNFTGTMLRENAIVCYRQVRKELLMLERKVLERGPAFETAEIKLKTEGSLDEMISLGPNETDRIVSVQTSTKSYPLPRYNEKCLLRQGKVKHISTKDCIAARSPGLNPNYNALLFLQDKRLLLTDSYYGLCCLMNENSNSYNADSVSFAENGVTKESRTDTNFIYPTALASGLIAISVREKKKICILSAHEDMTIKSEIFCKYSPTAIHGLRNGDIAVLWSKPAAFGIVAYAGGSISDRIYFHVDKGGKNIKHNRRMGVDENRCHVVLASKENSSISCHDFEANRIFEYKNSSIKQPSGIAVDLDGNIYVCERMHGLIYVLSPEGLLERLIQEGCPARPLGIAFSKDGQRFAVSQRTPNSQQIFFFSIEPNND